MSTAVGGKACGCSSDNPAAFGTSACIPPTITKQPVACKRRHTGLKWEDLSPEDDTDFARFHATFCEEKRDDGRSLIQHLLRRGAISHEFLAIQCQHLVWKIGAITSVTM